MLQLSEKMLIFEASSVEKDWRHREELLCFDPQVCQEGSHFFVLIIIKNKTICQSVLNVVVN